jgi:folate-binding protein YgfZ
MYTTILLPQLGVINVRGTDARQFLHNQLTQDFFTMKPNEARLTAYCSPKGRMLASFIGFMEAPDHFFLICHKAIVEPTIKRLRMFVLRSKVTLEDVSNTFIVHGHIKKSSVTTSPWQYKKSEEKHHISLYPALGYIRQYIMSTVRLAPENEDSLTYWNWLEVHSGIAHIHHLNLIETFIPQMLNYESIGGVNFKKGCFPGQEVVARSQFRGQIKRRAYIIHSPKALIVGAEITTEKDTNQTCGVIVQTASWNNQHAAIANIQNSALEAGSLLCGGNPLTLQKLPYTLREDL